MRTLDSLLKLQQLWLAPQEYRQAINRDKQLQEVGFTLITRRARIEPNSALPLEVLKNTNLSNRTNSPVGFAAGGL